MSDIRKAVDEYFGKGVPMIASHLERVIANHCIGKDKVREVLDNLWTHMLDIYGDPDDFPQWVKEAGLLREACGEGEG